MYTQTFLTNSLTWAAILLSTFCSTAQFFVWTPKVSRVTAARALGHVHCCNSSRGVCESCLCIPPLTAYHHGICWHCPVTAGRRAAVPMLLCLLGPCTRERTKFAATAGQIICQKANSINKRIRRDKLTCTLPSLTAGPSSASRRMNKPMLYSFPPRRLNPNPLGPLSNSTGKQPGFCAGRQRKNKMRTCRQI